MVLLAKYPPPGEQFCPQVTLHADVEHSIVDFYPQPNLVHESRETSDMADGIGHG
jgi:hypothetical protein